jgi:hypothetical protein
MLKTQLLLRTVRRREDLRKRRISASWQRGTGLSGGSLDPGEKTDRGAANQAASVEGRTGLSGVHRTCPVWIIAAAPRTLHLREFFGRGHRTVRCAPDSLTRAATAPCKTVRTVTGHQNGYWRCTGHTLCTVRCAPDRHCSVSGAPLDSQPLPLFSNGYLSGWGHEKYYKICSNILENTNKTKNLRKRNQVCISYSIHLRTSHVNTVLIFLLTLMQLFFPFVVNDNHWVLLCVEPMFNKIFFFDSLGSDICAILKTSVVLPSYYFEVELLISCVLLLYFAFMLKGSRCPRGGVNWAFLKINTN